MNKNSYLLIVDQDVENVLLFLEAFRQIQFPDTIIVRETADELMDFLISSDPGNLPDAIMIDQYLPRIYGWEVIEELKKDPNFSGIPLILLTGVDILYDKKRYLQCGADHVIRKPDNYFSLIETAEIIREEYFSRKRVKSKVR